MSYKSYELKWTRDKLWEGCMLASIAHAIMVAHYPELSNEHSWDGMNYNVQNSAGGDCILNCVNGNNIHIK